MSIPRKLACTVEAITDHGGRVYTLDLVPAMPAPAFKPGQFLHLTVDDYDPSGFWPESRVFSIASSPQERKRLRICYSVKGRYTSKMEQLLRVGGRVWVKMPYGDFIIGSSDEVVLLAGGTGISAFTAFIGALEPGHPRPVWLVYGAREPKLLLFHELLLEQARRVANFRLLYFAETGHENFAKTLGAGAPGLECLPGRIALESVWKRVPQADSKVFYLSGPPVMLKALGEQLRARGIAPDRVRKDAWE